MRRDVLLCRDSLTRTRILVFGGNRLDDFERRARGETYEADRGSGWGDLVDRAKNTGCEREDNFSESEKARHWFLQCGTTTVEAKSGYGLTVDDELKILRVIRRVNDETPLECVPTFLGAHAIPRGPASSRAYIDLVIKEMLPRVA